MFFGPKKRYERVAIITKDGDNEPYEAYVKKRGHKIVERKPDLVLCIGGDGTLLIAEREHPGVPKLIYKRSEHCNTCQGYDHHISHLMALAEEGKYTIEEHPKLTARWEHDGKVKGQFTCVNEFNIRNQLPIQALRFTLTIDGQPFGDGELIGDGAVICTAFGSKGYYHSITKSSFDDGIGVGLNNVTLKKTGIVMGRDKSVTVAITRMHADLAADNDPNIVTLEPGDTVTVMASAEKMKILRPQS